LSSIAINTGLVEFRSFIVALCWSPAHEEFRWCRPEASPSRNGYFFPRHYSRVLPLVPPSSKNA
jgi:hypothetical protein